MLVGNGARLGSNPNRLMGGANFHSIDKGNWFAPGARRNIFYGQAEVSGQSERNGYPSGVTHPVAYLLPQKAGSISSRFNIEGEGTITAGNLAGGLYGVSTLEGAGDVDGVISALGNIISTALGAGTVSSAAIVGNLEAAATLIGAGNLTGALISLVNASATLTGAGDIIFADITGGLSGSSTLTGAGELNGAIAGVVEALATISGSGTIVPADIVGVMNAVATLVGMGDLDGAIVALGHAEALLEGAGEVSNALPYASGDISATISATGELLTAQSIVDKMMAHSIEAGYSFEGVTKLMVAILAGKTQIVDNGNGTATVTFRSLNDDADRAIFEMVGSERTSRTDNL